MNPQETHTKPQSHEEEKRADAFSSPAFPRAFVASCEASPIPKRLDRICSDSPDLLAIIKQEGKV